MINRVILVGRMVADPELRYTPSGVAMSRFRVAVNRQYTSQQGEREADFIDIIAWRQNAQFAADYLHKGRLVGIEGRIQVRSFTTQEGQRRRSWEVVADRVQALERARPEDQERAAASQEDAGGESGGGGGEDYSYDDDSGGQDAFEGQ